MKKNATKRTQKQKVKERVGANSFTLAVDELSKQKKKKRLIKLN